MSDSILVRGTLLLDKNEESKIVAEKDQRDEVLEAVIVRAVEKIENVFAKGERFQAKTKGETATPN